MEVSPPTTPGQGGFPGQPGWARFGATFSERQVAAIAEIGRTIVSGADYEQVLAEVIEKVSKILDAESGGFMLYDEASGELVLQKPAFGFDSDELISAYHVPLSGGGNAVTVFVSGQPYFTNDAPNDPRVLQRFVRLYRARRILTVPLQIEGRPIGVFHATNKRSGDFTPQDVELALLLAPQLAVIIQSAAMMRELRRHQRQLERIIEIHNALVGMVLGGEDLQALADRLAELVALPVMVVDSVGRTTLCHDLKHRPEAAAAARAMHGLLAGANGSRPLEPLRAELGQEELMVVPIVVGPELLGGVGTYGPADRIDDLARRTLQQAALVFALEMVKEVEIYDLERRLHADMVQRLLVTESEVEARNLLRRLEVDPGQPLRGGRLRVRRERSEPVASSRWHARFARLHRTLQLLLARAWPGSAAVAGDEDLVLILPDTDAEAEACAHRLEAVLHDLTTSARVPEAEDLFLGVGSPATRAVDLRRSLEEATTVVGARRLVGSGRRVVLMEQMGLLGLLARPAGPQDIDRYLERHLGPLLAYDREHGSGWTTFLRTLAACNFSVKAAARRLGLHPNTGRYRAARIEELLGVDLSSATDRLHLQVALQLLDLQQTLGPLDRRAEPRR
ncbi:MAG TPA: GAF domain-containing protein [Candidatus Dormibacteraeota bacterium]|nr:GAF domain-containing protein [Candidatus Dormibacteraeota bacterium]